MKKRILAMALACLMALSVVSFVACDDEAIEEQATKIADLETATAALQTAIETKANASDLSDAVADFTAELAKAAAKGDVDAIKTALDAVTATADSALAKADANATAIETLKTSIAAIEAAIAEIETSVEANAADLADAIADMQAAMELLATKADLEAATAALQAAIDTKAAKEDVDAAIKDLKDAIAATNGDVEAVETALAAVKATAEAALAKAEAVGDVDALLETIKNVTALCTQLGVQVEGLEDAIDGMINIDDWNEATEGVSEAIIELTEAYIAINKNYYDAEELAKIEVAYKLAEVSITRAVNVAALAGAVEEFVETVESLPTVGDKVEAMFDTIEADLATLNTYYKAENGKSLLDDAAVELLAKVTTDLAAALAKYDTEFNADRLPDNSLGFVYNACAEALAKYNDRKVVLDAAKVEADAINDLIAEYTESFIEVTADNTDKLNALEARIAAWEATNFSGDFADEKANNSANYKLVKHADYKALADNYKTLGLDAAGCLEAFAKSLDFKVTLLSKADLDNSLTLYNAYTDKCKADGTSLDHKYNDKNGAYYLDILLTKTADYNALVKEAQEAYDAVYVNLTTSTVTIYDAAAIEAMLGWYAEYGVYEGETLVFGEAGYPLTTPVTEATYNALLEVKAACKTLVDAKVAETAAVNALLAALPRAGAVVGYEPTFGYVLIAPCATCGGAEPYCDACADTFGGDYSDNEIKLSDEATIAAARAAYDEWLNGTKAPEGYTADQFKIVGTDLYVIEADEVSNLVDAENYVKDILKSSLEYVLGLIEALDVNDPTQEKLDEIKFEIGYLVTQNCGDETCLSKANYDAVTAYELALYKKTELAKVQALYDAMKADLESVGINTDAFAGKYEALCSLVAAAENKTAVNDSIKAWTEGDYANAKAAYDLQVAKNAAKAEVKADYDAKVAEYTAAGKDAVTLGKFEALYTMTCGEIDDATTIEAVNTAVTRWDNERVNFYD